jgi:uncharacterized protein
VLILLPPSEGKSVPSRGRSLDLGSLSFPGLTETREQVLEALVEHCSTTPERAAATLGLGPTQADLVARNARLRSAPTARADRIYTGVLYDALGLTTIDAAAKRRAGRWLAVTSSLFGLVRPADRLPSYRLSGDVSLPGVGPVAGAWRGALGSAMHEGLGGGLLLDLRSTTYAAFWRPGPELAPRVAQVRVLHESGGRRTVVSHFNKATKGALVRSLLEEGEQPRTPGSLADLLSSLGWTVELGPTGRAGTRLDVVVSEVSATAARLSAAR